MKRSSWRLDLRFPRHRVSDVLPDDERFDYADAVVVSSADELHVIQPPIRRSLSNELGVEALAARLCPVQLTDESVAILALAEHVGGDQADELARQLRGRGFRMASPQRYVLAAPLLLSIARHQLAGSGGLVLLDASSSGSALAAAFQDMVEWGVRHGASDIHLNVHYDQPDSEVRFTIQGRYVAPDRFRRIPTATLNEMLAVIWMDIRGGNGAVFDPTSEQQGALVRQVDGRGILLRWASLAAERGPSVCLRLLDRSRAHEQQDLEQLGYLPVQAGLIRQAVETEGGAVVFAGTVGSGKSTSMAAQIAALPPDRKVMTLEDPVEYLIPGAVQNTISRDPARERHDGFAAKLRALKRSAMNDVLLGEVRDRETGEAFMDLASSGVSVYTTTHAPSAFLVSDRLASSVIGVARDFLATPGMLKLVVHQVLMPKLCSRCAVPAQAVCRRLNGALTTEGLLAQLCELPGIDIRGVRFRNPEGCPDCRGLGNSALSGYAGRTVVAECFIPEQFPGYLAAVRRNTVGEFLYSNLAGADSSVGFVSFFVCAAQKAARGEIDPFDAQVRYQVFSRRTQSPHWPLNKGTP
ncbi:general secretion pathway protein [Pusillimonas sp. T2]|uniref:GspE/PulE family protein n=1 Tax=Pusillimonas sp. T2 TaxID=1548123 RepID=UPI000B9C8694|nr:ATPase, T2SS/T4P/T4SS family [Pusillimonas sp. T2]OXR48509.1 general secretion pathway protein [Pusillimonas sp. T2]